jgi:uncharacterized protein (DUF302 family)
VTYGKTIEVRLPFEQAVERVKSLLKDQGFGVLCEIDVGKTLEEKTGAPFRPYRILGACNPQFARAALEREPQLGLLLPCNVVVQEIAGKTAISAIDARAMLSIVGNPELTSVADEVNERLGRVLDGCYADATARS